MMCKKLFYAISVAMLLCAAGVLQAAVLEITPDAPVPDETDIASFVGAAIDMNNVGTVTDPADYYTNDATTYVAHDRGGQGQTFVTGDTDALITGVWVQHAGYTEECITWYRMQPGARLQIRITDPAASGTDDFILSSEIYEITGEEDNALPANQTNDPLGTGLWIHVILDEPVVLAANTEYGFDLTSLLDADGQLYFETLGIKDDANGGNPYEDGSAYVTGSAGKADNTLTPAPGDRVFVVELEAAGPKVIWVTEAVDRDEDGVQDDQQWIDKMTAAGYNLIVQPDRYLTMGDDQDPNDTNDYVAELNAADLVIISRTASSGSYNNDANEIAAWASVTAPMISLSAYHVRSSRLQWIDSTTVNRSLDTYILSLNDGHAIFEDVTLEDGLVEMLFTEGFAAEYMGNCVIGSMDAGNGTIIAQTFSDEIVIAEWPAGAGYDGADVVQAGPRLLFCAGTQDTAGAVGQGGWNLSDAGEQMFLNAVNYMLSLNPVDPGTDDLVVAYSLDGDVLDSSESELHGTIVGDPNFVEGVSDMALSFDGVDDYVDTGNGEDLANWTISVWVKSPMAPVSDAGQSGPVHREANYQMNWDHGGSGWSGAVGLKAGGWHAASLGTLEGDTWYHLAGTYDGEDLKAYNNGLLVTVNSDPSGDASSEANSLKLGKHARDAYFFTGTIDEVKVYRRALSGTEILYLAGM